MSLATDLLDAPLAFVDVETTGGHPLHHRVIEIGVVLARGGELEIAAVVGNQRVRSKV